MSSSATPRGVPTPSDAPAKMPEQLGSQARNNAFDFIDVIPASREKREKSPSKHEGLEVTQLRQLLLCHALDHYAGIDFFLVEDGRDRDCGYVGLDSLAK